MRSAKTEPAILLVEDNAVNRSAIVAMLRALGYKTAAVANGLEGVEAAFSCSYAAIVMDIRLPGMDGWEVARRIRSGSGLNAKTPIVALTASTLHEDAERCLEAGMDEILEKPVSLDVLRLSLERCTGRVHDVDTRRDAAGSALLVRLLVEEATSSLQALDEAIEDGSAERVLEIAHALGGAAATAHVDSLRRLWTKLESLARSGRLDGAASVRRELARELRRLGAAGN